MADPPRAPGSSGLDVPGLWILSDDPYLITTVATSVEGLGVQIRTLTELSEASGGEAAGSRASEADSSTIRPDWLLADLTLRSILPERLESFKRQVPSCQLFLVASAPDAPVPAALARLGVRHWFLRPLAIPELRRVFRSAVRTRRSEIERQRRRVHEIPSFDDLIGQAPVFREACDLARRAAQSPSTVVLIEGETGTGKGIFARAIHRESPRSGGPFVEVNCASLPGGLLESELFGHEKGAFTHAQSAKPGLLELADSGSFFLDEVGETDATVQAKILKFLDSGEFRRVGGIEQREVDVRILAATQKDLEQEAAAGRFRSDLFHRLHVIRVRIPSLRERPGDALLLMQRYLDRFAARRGRPAPRLTPAARERLERHSWPGNVREVVNLCERLILLSGDAETIDAAALPDSVGAAAPVVRVAHDRGKIRIEVPDGVSFDAIEKAALEQALERAHGNVSAAAASLGMGRGQFRYRMERLGMGAGKKKRRRTGRRREAIP